MVEQETEMLARLLLQLPNKPALMWLEVTSPDSSPSLVVPLHTKVTIPYGIPVYDLMHAFPLQSTIEENRNNTPPEIHFFQQIYISDKYGHISKLGHRIAAFYCFAFLQELMKRSVTELKSIQGRLTYPIICLP